MKRTFWLALLMGPAVAAPTLVAPALGQAPAAPRNIWSFFGKTPEQKQACKDHFCQSAVGKMANSAAAPLGALSGGLITNRCAANAIENAIKNKPEGGAESAAAKIKKSEAEAAARRAAVRYLGTVDCSRFPDAQAVLIASLLEDPNECVRYEAALAFQNGCCCNKDTVKALTDVITGQSRVVETSERVKIAAAEALAGCEVAITTTIPPVIEERKVEELKKVELTPAEIMDRAREALATYRATTQAGAGANPQTAAAGAPLQRSGPARPTSVAAILSNAFSAPARSTGPALTEPASAASADRKAPGVVNALATSQPNSPLPASLLPATGTKAGSQEAPADRKPFLDNISRAFKGKQRAAVPPVELPGPLAGPPSVAPETQVEPGVTPLPLDLSPANVSPLPVGIPEGTTPVSPLTPPMAPVLPALPLPPLP